MWYFEFQRILSLNHPTEGAIAWEMELEALKERGVEQIDLIVSDALSGIENAVCSAFPTALHQLCVVHFKRKVLNTVSTKDKAVCTILKIIGISRLYACFNSSLDGIGLIFITGVVDSLNVVACISHR